MVRIAAVTEDGQRLSSHFGMAPLYRVFTTENGLVQAEETRQKPHHARHPEGEGHHDEGPAGHADMFAPIRDCQVLLVGGMGTPAYQKAQAAGLEVVLTGGMIEAAVQAYLKGEASSDLRRIHQH